MNVHEKKADPGGAAFFVFACGGGRERSAGSGGEGGTCGFAGGLQAFALFPEVFRGSCLLGEAFEGFGFAEEVLEAVGTGCTRELVGGGGEFLEGTGFDLAVKGFEEGGKGFDKFQG